VVKAILDILNKSYELIKFVKDRPGHDFRYALSTEKINTFLGWKAKINFEQGIEKTVHWYLDNRKWLEEKTKYLREYWKRIYK